MSCHSRGGFKSCVRLTSHLTGASRHDVEKNLHALRREATGADLPEPTQADIDRRYGEQIMELDAADLPANVKASIARDLLNARFETPPPDGRDLYVQSALLARTRQQEMVKGITGLVDIAPPGSQADQYERGEDGRPAKVWYASFGSNLYESRFNVYVEGGSPNGGVTNYTGCRDKTPPAGNIPCALPGNVHYAGNSGVWSGGVAFLDADGGGRALGRAYNITAEQFDDVVFQESNSGKEPSGDKVDLNATIANGRSVGKGVYGTLVHVGDYQGAPVMTFTSPFSATDALRGNLVYTPDNTLAPAAERTEHAATQKAAQDAENARAEAAGERPARIPADWPIYSSHPSESYQSMISGGLAETFGLTPEQSRTYFAGATGYTASLPKITKAA